MKSNRRNFLKMAGLTSIGLIGSCNFKGGDSSGTNSEKSTLANIPDEVAKGYSQIFNMSGYRAPKLDKVRVGIIGLGGRGSGAVTRLSYIEGVEIRGLCDVQPEQIEKAKARIKTQGHPAEAFTGSDESWMEMCRRDDLDLIYIATPWPLHAPMAIFAMENGKHAATEIPAAITVEDSWRLVQTSEKTKKHCVMLENCCYDFFELLTLNLARQGFFGDIIHCEGAYIHEIGESLFFRGKPGRSWRLNQNMTRNGNLYPTHGLGPVAQIMNINRGNRMEYLVSMQTDDFMMNDIAKRLTESEEYFRQFVDGNFRGNMNTTTIRTVKGQTIMLQHDVTTPRPYSRLHLVSGTKAVAQKYPLPPRIAVGHKDWLSEEEFKKLEEENNPVIISRMREMAEKIGGHGGMDFLMDWRLIDCLRNGLPVDMDVYDAASWSVIGPLSEWSVANRSGSIDIPDFTCGSWKNNVPHDITLSEGGTTGVRI